MYAVIYEDAVIEYYGDETAAYNEAINQLDHGITSPVYVVEIIKRFE
jgi:hypothetical protein